MRAAVEDEAAFSTWSSVTLNIGEAPANSPLNLPLKLEPYQHENEQFGYLPDYPLDNQMYFDMDNAPFVIAARRVYCVAGRYVGQDDDGTPRRQRQGLSRIKSLGTKIAFDRDNDVYFLGQDGTTTLLFIHATMVKVSSPGLCRDGQFRPGAVLWP